MGLPPYGLIQLSHRFNISAFLPWPHAEADGHH
jgi:hypothetical protein